MVEGEEEEEEGEENEGDRYTADIQIARAPITINANALYVLTAPYCAIKSPAPAVPAILPKLRTSANND